MIAKKLTVFFFRYSQTQESIILHAYVAGEIGLIFVRRKSCLSCLLELSLQLKQVNNDL